jgi:pimeloyl-ACP methyl ester carboxylesterase
MPFKPFRHSGIQVEPTAQGSRNEDGFRDIQCSGDSRGIHQPRYGAVLPGRGGAGHGKPAGTSRQGRCQTLSRRRPEPAADRRLRRIRTPQELDRISVNAVHDAIAAAARNPQVNSQCIAVIGGSKGAELALLLASHYRDIKAVVGLVPGYAVFVAHTSTGTTPSFSLDGKPLPFVPVPESAVPFLLPPKRNLRLAWDEMVKDKAAVAKAAIAVEKINGPILLISATQDEYWPSTPMSIEMGERLKKHGFRYSFQHVAVEGRHGDAYGRPELTQEFLRIHLLTASAVRCPRR